MKRQQLVSTLWMMGCRVRSKRSKWLESWITEWISESELELNWSRTRRTVRGFNQANGGELGRRQRNQKPGW